MYIDHCHVCCAFSIKTWFYQTLKGSISRIIFGIKIYIEHLKDYKNKRMHDLPKLFFFKISF